MGSYVSWTWETLQGPRQRAHEAAPSFAPSEPPLPSINPTCRPSGGEVYFFTIFEGPEGPEEERGVRLDRQFVDYTRPESCKGLVGGEEVVIREPSIQVLFRQALSTSTTQTLHGDVPGGGFTRRHLLACVQDVYTRIYEEEEAASPVPDRSGRPLLNRWGRLLLSLGLMYELPLVRLIHGRARMCMCMLAPGTQLASLSRSPATASAAAACSAALEQPAAHRILTTDLHHAHRRPTTHGPWGIWGHDLGDLLLWRMKKLGAEAPG